MCVWMKWDGRMTSNKLLTVGESRFRCGKSKSRICTKPIESWLERLRTISGVSAVSNDTVCESEMSKPRRHRVSASITSSVARSDIEMAKLCSTSLQLMAKKRPAWEMRQWRTVETVKTVAKAKQNKIKAIHYGWSFGCEQHIQNQLIFGYIGYFLRKSWVTFARRANWKWQQCQC